MTALHRIHKATKETIKDFYQTNPYMVIALKEWLIENEFKSYSHILDPCCGERVIGNGLRDYFPNITEIDKFADGCRNIDFMEYESKTNIDIIVENVPYSNKYNFINKSIELADYVFSLLPLNISNYNMFFKEYENIPEFIGKIQMSPKMFLDQTTDFKAGGTAQYCWYVWSKLNDTPDSKTWYKDLRVIKEREENK